MTFNRAGVYSTLVVWMLPFVVLLTEAVFTDRYAGTGSSDGHCLVDDARDPDCVPKG